MNCPRCRNNPVSLEHPYEGDRRSAWFGKQVCGDCASAEDHWALSERFWAKVDRKTDDQCWLWLASGGRYGVFSIAGKNHSASRVAWVLSRGEIPENQVVRHKCDNGLCCNPSHLELGTMADNCRDRDERGRGAVGSRHAFAKLTEESVREMRERSRAGESASALAREFGVHNATAWRAIHGEQWKSVAPESALDHDSVTCPVHGQPAHPTGRTVDGVPQYGCPGTRYPSESNAHYIVPPTDVHQLTIGS